MAYLLRNEEVVAKVVRATYYPALGAGEAICEGVRWCVWWCVCVRAC